MIKSAITMADKQACYGCAACLQACPKHAIKMMPDSEKFLYPDINNDLCVQCGVCEGICPHGRTEQLLLQKEQMAFGGYSKDKEILSKSTSGGIFSEIVNAFCDENYIVFGAKEKDPLHIVHTYITDKGEVDAFRTSKYLQSSIGDSYLKVEQFLRAGKKVLFSGTPCQIAGLKMFLKNEQFDKLLTIEVICEGVPSSGYMEKYLAYLQDSCKDKVNSVKYRDKKSSKWDFEVMTIKFNQLKPLSIDRWFNPFWSIWLQHLMSRPSCYCCEYTRKERVADITLGDLWGVHLYCPDLYNENRGASLVICNSPKGQEVFRQCQTNLVSTQLDLNLAMKYQSPLRKPIDTNPNRSVFFDDLKSLEYKALVKKYQKKHIFTTIKKYVWGNRQKIKCYNLRKRLKSVLNRGEKK